MTAAIIIPFRDRGIDPLRRANLLRVLEHWYGFEVDARVVDDDREGDAAFCRHRAYNKGTAATDADVLVYIESDILIPHQQIRDAITLAVEQPGLVVPFSLQHKLSPTDSLLVRADLKDPADCVPEPHPYGEGTNFGCANVISRQTLNMVGQWDEVMEGHGYDDVAMLIAFRLCAGLVRRVDGPAYHLYHKDVDPDTSPDRAHLTDEDVTAQSRNQQRMLMYRGAHTPEQIRQLTAGGKPDGRWGWRSRI